MNLNYAVLQKGVSSNVEQFTKDECYLACGSAVGRTHLERRRNKQDGVEVLRIKDVLVGIGSDGCSEGISSEIFGQQVPKFAVQFVAERLLHGVEIEFVPGLLYHAIVGYLRAQIQALPWGSAYLAALENERVGGVTINLSNRYIESIYRWVRHSMLFTVVGFVVDVKKGGVVFWRGDGSWLINDRFHRIQNKAHIQTASELVPTGSYAAYPGYELIPPSCIRNAEGNRIIFPTQGFTVVAVPEQFDRVAVMSDGTTNQLIAELWGRYRPKRFERFIARQKAAGYVFERDEYWRRFSPIEIQTLLDAYSRDRLIEDDAFVALAERIPLQ